MQCRYQLMLLLIAFCCWLHVQSFEVCFVKNIHSLIWALLSLYCPIHSRPTVATHASVAIIATDACVATYQQFDRQPWFTKLDKSQFLWEASHLSPDVYFFSILFYLNICTIKQFSFRIECIYFKIGMVQHLGNVSRCHTYCCPQAT